MKQEEPALLVKFDKSDSTSTDHNWNQKVRTICHLVLIMFVFYSCKKCPDLSSETTVIDRNPTTLKLNKAVKDLESILIAKGILTDTLSDSLDEIDKIYLMRRKIKGFNYITDQWNKSNPKSTVVRMDSYYEGCMYFTAYNRNLPNKLVLDYNNNLREVPFNDSTFEYKFKLKPYKLGENICKGFMVQGIDTYGFENRFTAIK